MCGSCKDLIKLSIIDVILNLLDVYLLDLVSFIHELTLSRFFLKVKDFVILLKSSSFSQEVV